MASRLTTRGKNLYGLVFFRSFVRLADFLLGLGALSSSVAVSRLRHRYHDATLHQGCQLCAIFSTCFGDGSVRLRYARLMADLTPRSPTGSTFGRRRANIRNMWAVQTPIPLISVRSEEHT